MLVNFLTTYKNINQAKRITEVNRIQITVGMGKNKMIQFSQIFYKNIKYA
jgi:hypothetical protein